MIPEMVTSQHDIWYQKWLQASMTYGTRNGYKPARHMVPEMVTNQHNIWYQKWLQAGMAYCTRNGYKPAWHIVPEMVTSQYDIWYQKWLQASMTYGTTDILGDLSRSAVDCDSETKIFLGRVLYPALTPYSCQRDVKKLYISIYTYSI